MPEEENDTVPGTADDTHEWHTIAKACELLNISKRTIWRRIEQGKLESKLEDSKRLILIPETYTIGATTIVDDTVTGTPDDTPIGTHEQVSDQSELISQLRSEIKYLRDELKQANERNEQSQERSDTIIMTLSKNLSDAQKALEASKQSWWKKLRLGKGKEKDKDDQQ